MIETVTTHLLAILAGAGIGVLIGAPAGDEGPSNREDEEALRDREFHENREDYLRDLRETKKELKRVKEQALRYKYFAPDEYIRENETEIEHRGRRV